MSLVNKLGHMSRDHRNRKRQEIICVVLCKRERKRKKRDREEKIEKGKKLDMHRDRLIIRYANR